MAGFNFGRIGEIVGNVMDTDKIDIGRSMTITNPDGSTGVTDPREPIYTDVPCHIDFRTADNPNPAAVDVSPTIISITIHCAVDVDLQAGDFVYAKKCDYAGEVLETYTGAVGFNTVHQSRKSVQLAMRRG